MMEQISNVANQPQTRKDRGLLSANKRPENDLFDSSSRLGVMSVIALTQFAFLTLGIATLKIMIHSVSSVPASIQWLDILSFWLFSIPVIWTVYATIIVRMDNPPLSPFVAQIIGIALAVLCFLFLAGVVFYLPTQL